VISRHISKAAGFVGFPEAVKEGDDGADVAQANETMSRKQREGEGGMNKRNEQVKQEGGFRV